MYAHAAPATSEYSAAEVSYNSASSTVMRTTPQVTNGNNISTVNNIIIPNMNNVIR